MLIQSSTIANLDAMSEAEFLNYALNALRESDSQPFIKAKAATLAAIRTEHIGEDFARHPFFY